jgi:DNA ligase-1
MLFANFADYLQRLEAIDSRLEMTAVLSELLRALGPAEIVDACYLLQGQLQPPYRSLDFQIAVKTVIKALARLENGSLTANKKGSIESNQSALFEEENYGAQERAVEGVYKKLGDLGLVAEEVARAAAPRANQNLNIQTVYETLSAIARESGVQSQQRKLQGLVDLLENLDPISAKFVVRIILGRLRLGFSDMTMIDALSWAMTGSKSERTILENAYQKKADIGKLAEFYLQQPDANARTQALENYQVEVGVPVIPALCQRLNSAAEMIEKMHDVIAEPKYDGLRVQIHVQKNATNPSEILHTYTRNLEETTHMFPELREAIALLHCQSCILDAEAIGFDPKTGELLPFQLTIQRKRKHDISEKAKDVPVRFYVFDVLSLDGRDLIATPLEERKALLAKLFPENTILYFSQGIRTSDPEVLREFHEKQLADGLEGAVVKQATSVYQSGRKGWSWVKIKEAEGQSGKLSDTLDVAVMGYYMGRGKRNEFGIGAFLVGVFDAKTDQICTIAKIGTGLTDEVLRETKQRLDALRVNEMPKNYQVNKMLLPDVWCRPEFVVEVAADELTHSPIHTAGFALRFPRLVKFRDDKTWQQITTLQELEGF